MSIFQQIYSDKYTSLMGDDNTILSKFTDLSPYILDKGQTLRIPQINYRPTLLKGLTTNNSFNSVTMSEAEQTLTLERYYITPLEIGGYEKMFEAYDKLQGIATNLAITVADYTTTDILIAVASQVDAVKIIPTTGSAGIANSPNGGVKKMIKIQDVAKLAKMMDTDKISKQNRFLTLVPEQIYELQFSTDNIAYNRKDWDLNGLASGVVANIAGINIISRADLPVMGTAGILPQGATYGASDVYTGLAFQSDHVGYVLGKNDTKVEFNQIKYATILTSETYALGGSLRSAGDRIGLYLIKQG